MRTQTHTTLYFTKHEAIKELLKIYPNVQRIVIEESEKVRKFIHNYIDKDKSNIPRLFFGTYYVCYNESTNKSFAVYKDLKSDWIPSLRLCDIERYVKKGSWIEVTAESDEEVLGKYAQKIL